MYRWLTLPLGSALVGVSMLLPLPVFAHEARDVGKYHFAVGFLNEPSITGQLNGIDLTITTTADKKPVVGADKTLKAEVIVGGNAKVMPLDLGPQSDESPDNGKYAAYFIPTISGSYTFHFSGAINGDAIDQRFESGPGRFDDVQAAEQLQFPTKLADPTGIQSQVSAAQATASQGRALGGAGLVVGALGLAVAGMTLVRGRLKTALS